MAFVFAGSPSEGLGLGPRCNSALTMRAILLAGVAATSFPAAAQPAPGARPQGGQVVAGAAQIGRTDAQTRIDQSSQRAAIDWRSFDVGSGQSVTFQQPSASAVTLNRVTSADPSQIAGKIAANGQVVLVNQSGVLFTKGAQVNAQSIIVSAAGITNQNFMAGQMVFDQPARPDAQVVNAGRITVKQAGLAALVAPQVKNAGTISARLGHVVLGGAETHTLDLYGDGLLSFDVTGQVKQAPADKDGKPASALVTNTGTIRADGGTVLLTASAVDGIVQNLVTAGGQISAASVGNKTGTIVLGGTGGSLVVAGSLTARGAGPGSTGGQIQVAPTGDVTVAAGAVVDASGPAGGGVVAIGTTLARARGGPSVTPAVLARSATIAKGATVSADATQRGQGGNVTVLSAQTTQHSGAITARGGPSGGNGGAIEISGQTLALTGTTDAGARSADGAPGTLLLDPDAITIVAANPYCPTAAPGDLGSRLPTIGFDPQPPPPGTVLVGTISDAEINAAGRYSDVTISAKNSLTVNGAYDPGGAVAIAIAAHALTLQSGGTVAMHSGASISALAITINGGAVGNGLDQPLGSVSIDGRLSANNVALAGGGGGISVAGSISGFQSVSLLTGGTAAVHGGASISAPNITMNGGAISNGQNQPLAGVSIDGTLGANTVALMGGAGGVSVAGSITGLQSVSLLTGETAAVHSGASIAAPSITMNGGALGNGQNQTLGGVSIDGALGANDVALTGGAGGVAVSGSIAGLQSVSLLTGGTVAVHGGASISAPNITMNGGALGNGQNQLLGGVSLNGALGANEVLLTGGAGGVFVAGSITGLGNIAHANISVTSTNAGPVVFASPITAGTLALDVSGSVTQQQPITVGLLSGSAGSLRLDTPGNDIAQFGALQVQNSLRLVQTPALTVAGGPVTAGGNIFLSTNNGIQIGNGSSAGRLVASSGGSVELVSNAPITEPNGTITTPILSVVAPEVQLGGANMIGSLAAGPVRGDQGLSDVAAGTFTLTNAQSLTIAKEVGGQAGVTLNAAGDLTLGTQQSRGILVAQGPINLNVSGGVTAPNGLISTAILSGSSRSLSLTALPQLFGTLGNYTAPDGIAIATAGDLVLNGNIATSGLHLDANGTISRAGGSLSVGSLSGSALHLADFGTSAQIGILGAFSVTGSEFALGTNVPLTIAGPLSAEFIRIRAAGQVTLAGTIATRGVPLALQSGAQPADPGSYIDVLPVRAGNGNVVIAGRFVESGSAAIVPFGASTATLRIGVQGDSGQITLGNLSAPQVFLVLDTGIGGRSSGTITVDGLLVLGTAGGARLLGTIDGFGGLNASFQARIEPRIDPAYTMNGCMIGGFCISAQNLPQVANNLPQAGPDLLPAYAVVSSTGLPSPPSPLRLFAVPQFPVPLGWISSPDVIPPNIAAPDY
jgi:filamentous hemagglutinin family protein